MTRACDCLDACGHDPALGGTRGGEVVLPCARYERWMQQPRLTGAGRCSDRPEVVTLHFDRPVDEDQMSQVSAAVRNNCWRRP